MPGSQDQKGPKNLPREPEKPQKALWMLGMFDVLGFSNRVETASVEAVFQLYEKLIGEVNQGPTLIFDTGEPNEEGWAVPRFWMADAHSAYFSDTILLWLPLKRMFARYFVERCSRLVSEALEIGVPLRGAISIGEGILHRTTSTYLGNLIVEAHKLEAAQDWIGVGFCPSATHPKFISALHPENIIEYEPPVKVGREASRSPIVLDWPRAWRRKFDASPITKLQELDTSPAHAKYYQNTVAFAEFSEKNSEWFSRPELIPPTAKLRMGKRYHKDGRMEPI